MNTPRNPSAHTRAHTPDEMTAHTLRTHPPETGSDLDSHTSAHTSAHTPLSTPHTSGVCSYAHPRGEHCHADRSTNHDNHDFDDWRRGDPAEIVAGAVDPLGTLLDLLHRARPRWHADAACRGSGVDFTSTGNRQRALAFTLCGTCPVRADCLAWALEIDDDVAILGGTDPAARRAMKRRTSREPTGDDA